MKLTRRTVLGFVPIGLMSGCAQVPSSGPVLEVSNPAASPAPGGVVVAPDPPAADATPELILAGFLTACLVPTDNYAVARQFLTPRASTAWVPSAAVNVYDSDSHPPVVTDSSALLRAPLLGTIDVRGYYTADYKPDFQHDFSLVKVGDQWRINSPGQGIFVSRYELHRAYSILRVHCLNRWGTGLVPQQVFMPNRRLSPTTAAQALLRGTSPWLRPAVTTAVIDGTTLAAPAVTIDSQGVAEVSLSAQIGALHDDQRRALAAQFLWTLGDQTRLGGLRLEQQGRPFAVPGAGADGVIRASALASFAPVVEATRSDAYVVAAGKLSRLLPSGVVTAGGVLSAGWDHEVQSISLSTDGTTVALVTDGSSRLFTARTDTNAAPTRLADGTEFLRPQLDPSGRIWVVDRAGEAGASLVVVTADRVERAILAGLPAAPLAARLSPAGERLAVIAGTPGSSKLGFFRVGGNPELVVDGWRTLTVVSSQGVLGAVQDVGWISATRMVVLAALDASSPAEVFLVDVDGSEVESLGPGIDMSLRGIAALPSTNGVAICALTSGGTVLVYQEGARWLRHDVNEVSAISYQG
ncbi:Lipoprotein LpqB beta-propeller domain-containing protein [Propionibacterium cyclohexanicum]|uniref:Lipoprotein LpqB beta-propeller domain-containing protein n=1 Tax=Propionibacterium cyclohexanicum TaxID=64702 RepID=A0A1H9RA95_9ACTN|nr:LpqB family beta-propeller domain-containing protein [Propionibacterium cyclohexanicum]SER69578.1 Lipoprotein LpqB beta-propeller domain-containing protein [Propionibacterium cyclohexanicum]